MALKLNTAAPDFAASFSSLLARHDGANAAVAARVTEILAEVRKDGFSAVCRLTRELDEFDVDEASVCVSSDEIDAACAQCAKEDLDALRFAADRIRHFHEKQSPADEDFVDDAGVRLGWRWTSVDAAGLYAPGGLAAYPSSVLMNAIAAQVAGVQRIVMTTPSPQGAMNPLVLAAARIAGVSEIYRLGGAQAIGALAFGAGPIAPVDVIVGPGNAYVAEAKRQVFGIVGIDSVAGPSEILVVSDNKNDPAWAAADLLSQAEHDASSQSILITDDAAFADAVAAAADAQLADSPRSAIAGAAWRDHSAIIVVASLAEAPALINRVAPEHLELAIDEPRSMLADIRHAGAIFLGRRTPEAVGDYVAGPNHVLPTSRAARYASGLSVLNFLKRSSLIECDATALHAVGPAAARLADAEGLPSHAQSVRIRLNEDDD
ncbi:MAG: histidinol dehydrogenase [Pseudomonadota bacterium]